MEPTTYDEDVDAVHPLFLLPKTRDASSSTDNAPEYFCKECFVYIRENSASITHHFECKAHKVVTRCVYCKGPVYEYFKKNVQTLYHRCKRDENDSNKSLTNTEAEFPGLVNQIKNVEIL